MQQTRRDIFAPPRRRLSLGRGLGESVRIAISSLRANKLRTLLTMLGIIIGVASVVALLAIGNGATASVTERITSIGSNLLTISPGQGGFGNQPRTQVQNLTMADAAALTDLPGVMAVAPVFQGNAQLVAGANNRSATVLGVTPEYFSVRNLDLAQGVALNERQVEGMESVAVLGSVVAEDLFGRASPVGSSVRINGSVFQVIGVLEESGGGVPGGSVDEQVLVPIGVAQLKLFGARTPASASLRVSSINVQVAEADLIDGVSALISATLRSRHNLPADGSADDFNIFNQAQLLESLNEITGILTTFLGAIAGISLVVGGIGVMNIMFVSVKERTREIGVRKAVGAKRRTILMQFLIEAVVVCMLGGLIGVGITSVISAVINIFFTAYLPFGTVALAFLICMLVGMVFGLAPAWTAAKSDPIESLRYE